MEFTETIASEIGKRGSSRRKGDEYQDIIALHLALTYIPLLLGREF